ncbi:hypothetical protein RU639_008922 [Aspergillus parasiticus]
MASSIGFSIGDFKTVFDMLVKACDAYKSSPQAFKGLLCEYESLYAMVQCVHMAGDEHVLDARVKKKLEPLIRDCNRTARHLRRFLGQYPSLTGRPNARERSISHVRMSKAGYRRYRSARRTLLSFKLQFVGPGRKGAARAKVLIRVRLLRDLAYRPYQTARSIQSLRAIIAYVLLSHFQGAMAFRRSLELGRRPLHPTMLPNLHSLILVGITGLTSLKPPNNRTGFHLSLTFQLAIQSSAWDIVETLVSEGIDPNGKSLDRRPAILVAASAKAWSVVKLLAQRGADLNVTNSNGHTCRGGHQSEGNIPRVFTNNGLVLRSNAQRLDSC